MAILKVTPFEAGPSSSGISMSQGETRGGVYFRIGFTAAAQTEFFGRALDPKKDAISVTVTDQKGVNHLIGFNIVSADDPAGLPFSGGVRGSIAIRVRPWRATASGKRPAASLPVINRKVAGGGISAKLPPWAVPEADPRAPP